MRWKPPRKAKQRSKKEESGRGGASVVEKARASERERQEWAERIKHRTEPQNTGPSHPRIL